MGPIFLMLNDNFRKTLHKSIDLWNMDGVEIFEKEKKNPWRIFLKMQIHVLQNFLHYVINL